MGQITKDLFFIPEVLADRVEKGLAGARILAGSEAAVMNTSMPYGKDDVGNIVKIPYFTSLGELEDLTGDTQALSPEAIESAVENATINHSGKAISATQWSRWNRVGDPYEIASKQIVELVARRADKALIDAGVVPTAGNANVLDVSAAIQNKLDYDVMVDAKAIYGDEEEDLVMLAVHSKTRATLRKLRDGNGRPLITDAREGDVERFCGVPIRVSDRLPVNKVTPGDPTTWVYTSMLCKRSSLIFWMNGAPRFRYDQDALADADLVAVHVYWAAHRYTFLNGKTTCGINLIKHKN